MGPPTLTLNQSLMSERPSAAVHPEIWALSALAAAAGGEVTGEMALGICGGAGLIGLAFRDSRAGRSTLHLSGWNPFQSSLLGGIERLGLQVEVRETSGRRRAARNLDRALADADLAVLWLDGATAGLAPADLRGMSPTVVVARPVGDEVEVAEGPGRAAIINREQLTEARLVNRTHRTRVVTVVSGARGDLAQLYRRGLAATAVGPTGGPPHGSGPSAAAELAVRLTDDGDDGWHATFPGAWELTRSLVALRSAIVREGGLLRRSQAAFTADAARATGLGALVSIATDYSELAAAWDAVADAALPADVPALAALRPLTSEWDLDPGAVGDDFALNAGDAEALLHDLAAQLRTIGRREDATLEQLRAVLRSA